MPPQHTEAYMKLIEDNPELPEVISAVRVLSDFIDTCTATTIMELRQQVNDTVEEIYGHAPSHLISLTSGCQLFLKFVTQSQMAAPDIAHVKRLFVTRSRIFCENALNSRKKVVALGESFIRNNATVLVHGRSRVVTQMLIECAKKVHFNLIVTESLPDRSGLSLLDDLQPHGIPATLILDAAVGHHIHSADLVLVGAEGITQNGGILNKIGTYSVAVLAKHARKPVYVVAESFKFARIYPLTPHDIPEHLIKHQPIPAPNRTAQHTTTLTDYTPPDLIALLLTDLGVLTPSAVSDELIKLYQ